MTQSARNHRSSSSDRRRHYRAPYELLIQYINNNQMLTANAEEISESGVQLEVFGEHPLDTPIEVLVPLRGRYGRIDICRIKGRVIHRQGHQVGIAFEDLLPRHMLQLRDYVYQTQRRLDPSSTFPPCA